MSNSNGYIKAPVNIAADLGYVLGTGSGDLGYNIANGNINKWAMFKPVRDSAVGWVSPRNTLAKMGFGGTLPRAASIAGLISLYDAAGVNGWEYLRPRGASQSEFYRAADFCKIVGSGGLDTANYGYNHNARNPFGSSFSALPSVVSKNGDILYVQQGRITPSGSYPDTDIAIYDFNQVLNSSQRMKYYGCVVKGNTGSASSVAARLFGSATDFSTAERGKENLYFELPINASKFQTLGGYIVYPCVSNYALSPDGSSMVSGQYLYPIPGAQPVTFELIEDYIVITVTARALNYTSPATYYVQWSYTVYNYHDFAINLTNGKAKFRYQGKQYSEPITGGEQELNLSDITVPAGGSYSYPGGGLTTDTTLSDRDLYQLIIGFQYNSQLKTGYREFIVPAPPM